MRPLAVLFLFIGMFMIVQGYYSEKTKTCPVSKTEVKYIPRSLYEEQMTPAESLDAHFKSMFRDVTPDPV